MTREKLLRYGKEYLHELETGYCCKINGLHLNFVRESIKALEQEPILNKIRAEIEAYAKATIDEKYFRAFQAYLHVIDYYTQEER